MWYALVCPIKVGEVVRWIGIETCIATLHVIA